MDTKETKTAHIPARQIQKRVPAIHVQLENWSAQPLYWKYSIRPSDEESAIIKELNFGEADTVALYRSDLSIPIHIRVLCVKSLQRAYVQ
jgi:hypothetical protein